MRFEVVAAFVIGLGLPVLETVRRGIGHWAVDASTMLEDYLGGALLLLVGVLAVRRAAAAPLWLVVAWSCVTAMMTMSLLGQIEEAVRGVDLEPNHRLVLGIKAILWLTCAIALAFSLRRASKQPNGSN